MEEELIRGPFLARRRLLEMSAGYSLSLLFFGHIACGILVPWLGIKPKPPALEAQSLNH